MKRHANAPDRHGGGLLPVSAVAVLAYALLHAVLWLYWTTVLRPGETSELWSRQVWLGLDLRDVSLAVGVLITLYAAADFGRALSRPGPGKPAVLLSRMSAVVLSALVLIYLWKLGGVLVATP